MSMICSLYALGENPLDDSKSDEGEVLASIDLDKAWHGIHFCLTGSAYEDAPPLDFLLLSGTVLEEISEMPRYFSPDEVGAISAALANVTAETLRDRYDPAKMDAEDIYPQYWAEDADEGFEYIASNFKELKAFMKRCSESSWGLMVLIC